MVGFCTESLSLETCVQILNKFIGSNSEEDLYKNDETLKEITKGIDDEITDLEDFDDNLKSGIMFTAEFIP